MKSSGQTPSALIALIALIAGLTLASPVSAGEAPRLVTRTVRVRPVATKAGAGKDVKAKATRAAVEREDWLVAPVAGVDSRTRALLLSRLTAAPKVETARLERGAEGWAPVGSSVALGKTLTRRLEGLGGVASLVGDLEGVLPKTALEVGESRVIKGELARRFWSPGRFDRVKLTLVGAPRDREGRRVVGLQLHLDRFGDKGFTTLDLRGRATLAGPSTQLAGLTLSGVRVTREGGKPELREELELQQSARGVSAESARALREGRAGGLAAFGPVRAVRGESFRLLVRVRSVIDLGNQMGNDGKPFDVTQTVDLETVISKVREGRAAEARVTIKRFSMDGNMPNNRDTDALKGRAMVWKMDPGADPVPAEAPDGELETTQVTQMTRAALPTKVYLDSLQDKRIKLGSTVRLSRVDAERLIFQQAGVKVRAEITLESLVGQGADQLAVFKAKFQLKPGDGPGGVTGELKGEVRVRVRDSRITECELAGDLDYPNMPDGAKAKIHHKTSIRYQAPARPAVKPREPNPGAVTKPKPKPSEPEVTPKPSESTKAKPKTEPAKSRPKGEPKIAEPEAPAKPAPKKPKKDSKGVFRVCSKCCFSSLCGEEIPSRGGFSSYRNLSKSRTRGELVVPRGSLSCRGRAHRARRGAGCRPRFGPGATGAL